MSQYKFGQVTDIIFKFEDGSECSAYWVDHTDSFFQSGKDLIDPTALNKIFEALADQNQLKGY